MEETKDSSHCGVPPPVLEEHMSGEMPEPITSNVRKSARIQERNETRSEIYYILLTR